MNTIKSFRTLMLAAALSAVVLACKDDNPTPEPVVSTTLTDLSADPGTGVNPTNGQPTGITNKFTLFSFKTGVVANTDSATAKWDVGFRRTTIIINGGTSGPGAAGAIVKSGLFDEILEAPTDGYLKDDKNATVKYAIPTGSGNGWYTYDGGAMVIKPTAGKVLIFQTADGRYAKVEILSYYKGAKTSPVNTDVAGYYTFRYVYQPNDTKSFK